MNLYDCKAPAGNVDFLLRKKLTSSWRGFRWSNELSGKL